MHNKQFIENVLVNYLTTAISIADKIVENERKTTR